MDNLVKDGLNITIENAGDKMRMAWHGASRDINVVKFLDPYLENFSNELDVKDLTIDFSNLKTMNSSTIPPILNFIKILEEKKVKTEIIYNYDISWQRSSFVPLSSIIKIKKYKNIKINVINYNEMPEI